MEQILKLAGDYGIGLLLAAAVIAVLLHLVKVVIPRLVRDHSRSLAAQRRLCTRIARAVLRRLQAIDGRLEEHGRKLGSLESSVRSLPCPPHPKESE